MHVQRESSRRLEPGTSVTSLPGGVVANADQG